MQQQGFLSVLAIDAREVVGASPVFADAGFVFTHGDALNARGHDLVLVGAGDRAALQALSERADLLPLAYDLPLVVATEAADAELEAALLRQGVEAIVAPRPAAELARALRHAHLRKEAERAARTAYATDLATGLPHQAQLLEHMTQLLALREREAAPLVLIVLRIEGVAQAVTPMGGAGGGGEAANVLRRKVAVRLRGGLRASDVVASLGTDLFAVMLGRVDMVADGDGVAAKLLRALEQPFAVAGRNCNVGAVVGVASYPAHGKEAKALLQRATAQAAMLATVGEQGVATVHSTFSVLGGAANDSD